MTHSAEIIFTTLASNNGNLGLITLNRPEALNATNLKMLVAIAEQLKKWEHDATINAVVIKSNCEKAFCAGGDIREIYQQQQKTNQPPTDLHWQEYRLNYYIAHYAKPYIALLDGITMGGGVGISIYGKYRIATERTLFAMPETSIGFFPDIGASYFLARCPGQIGIYLGLTGARLQAADTQWLGFTDYFVNSAQLTTLINALLSCEQEDIAKTLNTFTNKTALSVLATQRALIDECFCFNTIEEIINSLQNHSNVWCQQTAALLLTKSPTSLKVTLEQLRRGAKLNLADCLKMEYRITNHMLKAHDFYEGVRAVLIDKDHQPQWQPATLAAISAQDVNAYFAPLLDQPELALL